MSFCVAPPEIEAVFLGLVCTNICCGPIRPTFPKLNFCASSGLHGQHCQCRHHNSQYALLHHVQPHLSASLRLCARIHYGTSCSCAHGGGIIDAALPVADTASMHKRGASLSMHSLKPCYRPNRIHEEEMRPNWAHHHLHAVRFLKSSSISGERRVALMLH